MGSGLLHVVAEVGEGLAFGGGAGAGCGGQEDQAPSCACVVRPWTALALLQQVLAGLGSWPEW